jgi:hypothetical protein
MSPLSTSFYGIRSHDDHDPHQNFMAPIDSSSNTSSGEPFYPTPFDGEPAPSFPDTNNISATQSHEELPAFLMNGDTDDAGLAPVFPTYNEVPHFQTQFPFVTSSLLFPGLSLGPESTESTLAPSSRPSHGSLPKRRRKSEYAYKKRITAYLASKKVAHIRGLNRNKIKRQYGSGYADMFVR